VLTCDGWSVVVRGERGVRHHLPHAHVRKRGERELVVSLPTLRVIAGPGELPRSVRECLEANVELLVSEWERRNG